MGGGEGILKNLRHFEMELRKILEKNITISEIEVEIFLDKMDKNKDIFWASKVKYLWEKAQKFWTFMKLF